MSNLQKKCLIIRNAYSYDFGGGEKFPVNLAVQLNNLGYSTVVVSRNDKLLQYASSQGISNHKGWWWSRQYFSGRATILFPAYLVWQLVLTYWYLRLIIKHKASVIHPQSRDDFVAATIAGRLLGKTVIWTDHADLKYVFLNHRSPIKNPVGKLTYIASKLAHSVTLVSHSEYSLVKKSLGHKPPKNYKVIHNGVSHSTITPIPRDKKYKDTVIFTATSRLVHDKGIGELIKAFMVVNKKHNNAKLWLFGEGPNEAEFRKLASTNSNIIFKGYAPNTEAYVQSCDIFVHPSYHEGFSISVIEAAKAGLPIIACAVGGNLEIVNSRNGILVAPKDTDSLAKAMLTLTEDAGMRKAFGYAARNTYENEFVFEDIVKNKFIKLYENKKPLKILFDANPMVNGNKSGIGYYTYYLVHALAKFYPDDVYLVGHYFNFLNGKKNLALPTAPNITYVQSKLIPGKILSFTRKFGYQLPLELFFKQRGDVAMFTNFVSLPSIFNTPIVPTVHDMCFIDVPEYVAVKNRNFLQKFVPKTVRGASKIITISDFSKRSIVDHYRVQPSKITITPIPPDAITSRTTTDFDLLNTDKYILFLGTLEPRKNIINLVKGYEKLPNKIKNKYALVLAGGSGWYFEETMKYINNLISKGENIILTGYITDDEKTMLYKNCSLFVMPSHYEGFGMPILEAMSYGVPTAVSDISVFKEVAGSASAYFNKDDSDSIANVIADTLQNDLLRTRLIKEGLQIAASYDWNQVAEIVYETLLNTTKKP